MHVYEGIAAMVNARTSPRVRGNRLVEVVLESGGDETTVAAYEYDGKNRRTMKVVSNCGVEDTPNDGGNTTVEYYYGGVTANVSSAVDGNRGTPYLFLDA